MFRKILFFLSFILLGTLFSQNAPPFLALDISNGTDLVWVDPASGNQSLVASANPPVTSILGRAAVDPVRKKYYCLFGTTSNTDEFLLSFDYGNGTFDGMVLVDSTDQYRMWNLFYDPGTDKLYSTPRQSYSGSLAAGNYLVSVDPQTGSIQQLSPNPIGAPLSVYPNGQQVWMNRDLGALQFIGSVFDPNTSTTTGNLITVDLATANTTIGPNETFSLPHGGFPRAIVYNQEDSLLHGIADYNIGRMVTLDPNDGDVINYGDSVCRQVLSYDPAYNPSAQSLSVITSRITPQSTFQRDILTLNLRTGQVMHRVSPNTLSPIVLVGLAGACEDAEADFSFTANCALSPSDFEFTGTGTSVSWDFGNPSSSSDTASGTNVQYSFPEAGVYEVTLFVESCGQFDTLSQMVTIPNGLPPLMPDTTICPGETLSIGFPGHNWPISWSTGALSSSIEVTSSGVYIGSAFGGTNCAFTDTVVVSPGQNCTPTGTSGLNASVFPNPGNQSFELKIIKMDRSPLNIEILSPGGEVRFSASENALNPEMKLEIPTTTWPEGLYFIRLWNENQSAIRKVIITHQ